MFATKAKKTEKSISGNFIQPKLKIGKSGDRFEIEADRVADKVVQQSNRISLSQNTGPLVQKQCSGCEDEELQMKPILQNFSPMIEAKSSLLNDVAPDSVSRGIISAKGSGRPLGAAAKSFMENQFGNDFSKVKIHTNEKAAQLNQQISARAFTVGNDIFFNKGEYRPNSNKGKHLLAHELTHTLQQVGSLKIQRVVCTDETREGICALMPGYSQDGDTCGATSLVSALMIYDNEQGTDSTELILASLNTIQTWLIHHRSQMIREWDNRGIDGEAIYRDANEFITLTREQLVNTTTNLSEQQFKTIGVILYSMYVDGQSGLSSSEISALQGRLGLSTNSQSNILNYPEIFSNSVTENLNPGQLAQVGWIVRRGEVNSEGRVPIGHHAFIIGRFRNGDWFLSDQGTNPATEIVSSSLSELQIDVSLAARNDGYWIYTGSSNGIMGWTGVRRLASPDSVIQNAQSILVSGTELLEIDAGALTIGDTIISGDFVETTYSLGDAYLAAGSVGSGHGSVIIEIPQGVFLVYETNLVSTSNLLAVIDRDAGGKLIDREIFYSARVVISDGNASRLIEVYD